MLAAIASCPFRGAAEPIHRITLDGDFADWAGVPSYTDPADDQHDTDHSIVRLTRAPADAAATEGEVIVTLEYVSLNKAEWTQG